MKRLLHHLRLSRILNPERTDNCQSCGKDPENLARDFFSRIPRNLTRKIWQYYELDFDLFGYNKTDALKYVNMGYE